MKSNRSRTNHNEQGVPRERLRNNDGSFRRTDSPSQETPRSIIAHWLEEEVAARRIFADGSFAKIAALAAAAAHRRILPRAPLPAGVKFPDNYTVSGRGALKAFARYKARGKTNRANRKRSDSKFECEMETSPPERTSDDEPLRVVRLQIQPRRSPSSAEYGSALNLGTFDLGDLDSRGLPVLVGQLGYFRAAEVGIKSTKTTLQPDIFYTADPKYEEIRKALTLREQAQIARIWERGKRRALKKSEASEGQKSGVESLNPRSEVSAAEPSGSKEGLTSAAQVRSKEISPPKTSRVPSSHALTNSGQPALGSTQKTKVEQSEQKSFAVSPHPADRSSVTPFAAAVEHQDEKATLISSTLSGDRGLVFDQLDKIYPKSCRAEQIAQSLGILEQRVVDALQVLDKEEEMVERVGRDQWKKRANKDRSML
jgi:hypothetical protein